MNALTRLREQRAGLTMAVGMIAHFEGGMSADGKYRAYWDAAGRVWTIGHGETSGVRPGMVWSARKADRMLRRRLRVAFAPELFKLKLPMRRHMIAATLSFIWNEGPGMLDADHDFGRELRAHHWRKASASLDEYVKAGVPLRVMPGLVNRRNAEQHTFNLDLGGKR